MWHSLILVGNLGRDPEMRYTPSGQAVTNFSVAVNNNFTSKDGEAVKQTAWFRISTWGKQAETCNQYLHKGSKVLVEGRMIFDPATGSPRVYAKQDGTSGASFEVNASTVRFLSPKGEGEPAEAVSEGAGGSDEDVPF